MKILRSANASQPSVAAANSPAKAPTSALKVKDLYGRWKGDLGAMSLDVTISERGTFIWVRHGASSYGYGGVTTNAQPSGDGLAVTLHRILLTSKGNSLVSETHVDGTLISPTEWRVSAVYHNVIAGHFEGSGILYKVAHPS